MCVDHPDDIPLSAIGRQAASSMLAAADNGANGSESEDDEEPLAARQSRGGTRPPAKTAPAQEEAPVAAPARPKTAARPKKNVTFAAPPPPAQIYVRKRDAFAVFCVAVIAAVAGHYFGTLANAPPDVAAIAEYVQEAPLFGTTADLLGDALAKARLATSVLRECLE